MSNILQDFVLHWDWGLVSEFGANEPRMVFGAKLGNRLSDFNKKPLILFRISSKKD